MSIHISVPSRAQFRTQPDVDKYIAQAHQLRAAYIAASMKSGLAYLRDAFSPKRPTVKATL
ncbi:RSP_7527 family protein [Roseovarius sp. Pro17]|uniref:RSP_7527 family protein n=1 Tax=Roseovarius sp. Pro17 TaxID=3108175 RepID=UPI003A7F3A44